MWENEDKNIDDRGKKSHLENRIVRRQENLLKTLTCWRDWQIRNERSETTQNQLSDGSNGNALRIRQNFNVYTRMLSFGCVFWQKLQKKLDRTLGKFTWRLKKSPWRFGDPALNVNARRDGPRCPFHELRTSTLEKHKLTSSLIRSDLKLSYISRPKCF